jgi:short-subunit dehydrogenase
VLTLASVPVRIATSLSVSVPGSAGPWLCRSVSRMVGCEGCRRRYADTSTEPEVLARRPPLDPDRHQDGMEEQYMTKLALVTGASSGIGRAFAERLAADGYDLVAVGRRRDRLEELAASVTDVKIQTLVADLSTDEGIEAVADVCVSQGLSMLVNNAGVAHYMPISQLPADKANEVVHVKVVAPTMLIRAAVPGMIERGDGTIINVAGMLAFSGPAPNAQGRAVYAGTLAHLVTMTQVLHEELKSEGLKVQVVCPGIVVTEFHERQGLDLSAVPRMSAGDVVSASLRGLELGEIVCAPGVAEASLLEAVFQTELAAFGGQSHQLAVRYRTN